MDKEKITIKKDDKDENVFEMKVPQSVIEEHHSHIAPILGVLLILLVIILGGLYLWGAALTKNDFPPEQTREIPNNEPETTRAVADEQILQTMSPSDSLDSIEADIESTNLDSLDSELNAIEAELDAALQTN